MSRDAEWDRIFEYLARELGAGPQFSKIETEDALQIAIYGDPEKLAGGHARVEELRKGVGDLLGRSDVRIVFQPAPDHLTQRAGLLHCSFCGKSQTVVAKLIAGPGVYICDECVGLCNQILDDEAPPIAPTEVKVDIRNVNGLSTADLLAELGKAGTNVRPVEQHIEHMVRLLRDQGVTWALIGSALGMTRQGAWGRFSGEE